MVEKVETAVFGGRWIGATLELDPWRAVEQAAAKLGAKPAERVPGLWDVPGYPELSTGQLLGIAARRG